MLALTVCKFTHFRLRPAWGSSAAGWQFHWLWFYVEWLNDEED